MDKLNNTLARLAGIILAPRRTIPIIIGEERFWVPIIILVILLTILRLVMLPEMYEYYSSEEFRELLKETRKSDDVEMEQDIALMKKSAPFIAVLEAALTVFLGTGGITILLYLIGRLIYKQKAYLRAIFAMVAWTSIIGAIPLSCNILLKLANPDWYLPTNLSALFTPEVAGDYFSRVLSIIDIFLIWQVWLISIGMSVLYGVSIQRAVSSVGSMFVFFAVLNALALGQVQ